MTLTLIFVSLLSGSALCLGLVAFLRVRARWDEPRKLTPHEYLAQQIVTANIRRSGVEALTPEQVQLAVDAAGLILRRARPQ